VNIHRRSNSSGLIDRVRGLEHYWYSKNAVALALLPLSWVFCTQATLRHWLHLRGNPSRPRLPVPVIVVGNISVGGTGKTPLVIWLAELLKASGFKTGIISRGYGGKAAQWPQRVTGESDPYLVGDEPVLIAKRCHCPTVVAPRRTEAARALLAQYDCDVLISDDGLQHYGLIRDIEIVVVDGDRGLGNGWCLPAGPLRERPVRLRDVDFVVTQGASDSADYTMMLRGKCLVNLCDRGITRSLNKFLRKPVHAVAGIGNPARFFDRLTAGGLQIQAHAFPDHHRFTKADIDFGDRRPVLMTEKDAVKCRGFARPHHWYLPVSAVLSECFAQQVLGKLRSRMAAFAGIGK
jgi:tetraacyldisaccharide 4'-kinase